MLNRVEDSSGNFRYVLIPMAALLFLSAIPVLSGLRVLWHSNENFEGLLLIPFMCGLICYRNKDKFALCRPNYVKPILYSLPIVLGAMFTASAYGLPRIAGLLLPVSLMVASLGFFGFSNYKLFACPLLFLVLMVPPPLLVIEFATINLQKFFSIIMEALLNGFSNTFLERHDVVFLFADLDYPLVIAPECSGIRSLIGFVIMSSFFAAFDRHSVTITVLMILTGVITALSLNFFRILIVMQLKLNGFEAYSLGIWHGLLGILVFVIGCLTLSKLSRIIKHLDIQNRKEDVK